MSKKRSSKVQKISSKSMSSYSVVEKEAHHRLKDYQNPDSPDFEFVRGKLLYLGKEIGPYLRKLYQSKPALLSDFAQDLQKFREHVVRKKSFLNRILGRERVWTEDEKSQMSAQVDAYLQKISEYLRQSFEQAQDGLVLYVDENEHLLMNAVNLTVLLQNSQKTLSDKQKLYLKSITQKLELALEKPKYNRPDSKIYDKIMKHLNHFLSLSAT